MGTANAAAAERYSRFMALRDSGMLIVDVIRELGVSEGTAYRYERSYRQLRNLPGKSQAPWLGAVHER
jgi:transposase